MKAKEITAELAIQGYKQGLEESKTALRLIVGKLRKMMDFKVPLDLDEMGRLAHRGEKALQVVDRLFGEKSQVPCFHLQETISFPDGAPQREEYDTDNYFYRACRKYEAEWRLAYEHPGKCENRDCPQCWTT